MQFSESCRQGIDELIKNGSALPKAFQACLLHIKPKFVLKDKSDNPVVEISDDDSDGPPAPPVASTPKRRQGVGQITPSSKRARLDSSNSFTNGHTSTLKREETASPSSVTGAAPRARKTRLLPPFTEYSSLGSGFRTLAQIKAEIHGKMQAGTPDVIPPDVFQDLAMESIKVWEQPMKTFLSVSMGQLHTKLRQKLDSSLDRLRKRLIYRETAEYLKLFLQEQLKKTEEMAAVVYKHETQQLITFQEETFKWYRELEIKQLQWFRHEMRQQARFPELARQLGNWDDMNDEQKLHAIKEQDKERSKLGLDDFADEILVIAYVRAYYRLAALRFVDRLSQLTLCGMLPEIRMRLDFELRSRLGIHGTNPSAAYQRLMEEDTATAAKREALKAEREKFVRALETIQALEGNPGLDDSMYDASSTSLSFTGRDRDVVMEDSQTTSELASGEA